MFGEKWGNGEWKIASIVDHDDMRDGDAVGNLDAQEQLKCNKIKNWWVTGTISLRKAFHPKK